MFAPFLRDLAIRRRGTPDGRQATQQLIWVDSRAGRPNPDVIWAVDEFEREYLCDPDGYYWALSTAARHVGRARSAMLLERVRSENPSADARRSATWGLAQLLSGEDRRVPDAAAFPRDLPRAASLLRDVIADAADEEEKMMAQRTLRWVETMQPGMPAPPLAGVDLNERPIALADFRGRVVWVHFWAMWCYPCRVGLPKVIRLAGKMEDRGVVLLGVNADRELSKVQEFTRNESIAWRNLWAIPETPESPAETWCVGAWPTDFVIDAKGVIRGAPDSTEEVEALLESVLREEGGVAADGKQPAAGRL